jgi:fructoselysine-6-phosphate deglycase
MKTLIRQARSSDGRRIKALLKKAELPYEDVEIGRQTFLVATSGGRIGGTVGMEAYGVCGLLRSLAVDDELRGHGLGSELAEEMVEAVEKANKINARVIGFIDKADANLAKMCTYCISYNENEQLKFFMTANRFLYRNGEFPDYERYNSEMEAHLATALVEIEKAADVFGAIFAEKHCEDPIHYFVGAGVQWGATYSYAMCYWEEQHWIRTKSITAEEFFHGMFEIVDKNTAVTVFLGEDEQRPLAERVAAFLPQICGNYTLIDAKDYAEYLDGISPEFRGSNI